MQWILEDPTKPFKAVEGLVPNYTCFVFVLANPLLSFGHGKIIGSRRDSQCIRAKMPAKMLSDNELNFVGAEKEIRELERISQRVGHCQVHRMILIKVLLGIRISRPLLPLEVSLKRRSSRQREQFTPF